MKFAKNSKQKVIFKKSDFIIEKKKMQLVLPFKQISFQPEHSSPHCFRTQGGSPEFDKQTN